MAMFAFAQRSWDQMPWIIVDFKHDSSLAQIPAVEMDITGPLPTEPGIYIVHPMPDQKDEMEDFFFRVWEQENIGLFIDESYMIGQHNKGYRTVLTQGRSKHIPVIMLSQRPVAVDTFTFSEADFIQVFDLNMKKDRDTIEDFVPVDMDEVLPDYHSHYYDVAKKQVHKAAPVPPLPDILKHINARIDAARRRDEPLPMPAQTIYRL